MAVTGLNQVYLEANKESFVVNWYLRKGFRIYNDNPENGKGHTVAMKKYYHTRALFMEKGVKLEELEA